MSAKNTPWTRLCVATTGLLIAGLGQPNQLAAQAACTGGTLQSWIDLGPTGCTVGDFIYRLSGYYSQGSFDAGSSGPPGGYAASEVYITPTVVAGVGGTWLGFTATSDRFHSELVGNTGWHDDSRSMSFTVSVSAQSTYIRGLRHTVTDPTLAVDNAGWSSAVVQADAGFHQSIPYEMSSNNFLRYVQYGATTQYGTPAYEDTWGVGGTSGDGYLSVGARTVRDYTTPGGSSPSFHAVADVDAATYLLFSTSEQGTDGTVTPEPVTMTLLGTGLAGIAAARRRRRDRAM